MFHVHDELEQSLLRDQFNQSPCYNANLVSESCMGMDGGTTSVVNSSNFVKLQFVKIMNKHGVFHIMLNTS
jgi:hypothetical protein